MSRSRVTLASTLAAATHAATRSPFHTARPGTPNPSTGKPSVSTYSGPVVSKASARRIADRLQTCRPRVSTSAGGTMITEYASNKYQDNRDIQPSLLFKELNPDSEKDPQLKLNFGMERSHR